MGVVLGEEEVVVEEVDEVEEEEEWEEDEEEEDRDVRVALTLVSPSSVLVVDEEVLDEDEVAGMGETVMVRVLEREVLDEWKVV